MEQRTYHGQISPQELADVLRARFSTGDMTASLSGTADKIIVNIATSGYSGGRTSLAVGLSPVSDGVTVTVGDQNLLGVAADLLQTGLGALWNPVTIIGEIDDVAHNVDRLSLPRQVWETIDHYCRSVGAGMAPEPTTVTCPYCGGLSPIGTGTCPSCGAPLGEAQPITCPRCGRGLPAGTRFCTRCGASLSVSVNNSQSKEETQRPSRPPFLARFTEPI